MAAKHVRTLEPKTHLALSKLHLVLSAATGPRGNPGAVMAASAFGPTILADLRRLVRLDLSGIEDVAQLALLLEHYREMAAMLERVLEIQQTKPRKWTLELLGTPEQIESVLEAIEEKIEDLEIATNPDVHVAIEQLIAEAKSR